jgi:CBS-domain-containing membrane protein
MVKQAAHRLRRRGMKTYKVKELMIPLEEYATVPEGATLYDAFLSLEKAQNDFDQSKYRHRGILVLDKAGKVIGKISQLDAISALEPKYREMNANKKIAQYFSSKFLKELQEQFSLMNTPLENICQKAAQLKVEDFMATLSEGEFVEIEASLDTAIHQLVMGHHQSLLVKKGPDVVGILRLTDVFAAVYHAMKECLIQK